MVQIGSNRYGKSEVRVVRVARGVAPDGGDVIRDWNVSTALSGDLDDSHLTGDNSKVLPTDSQKNRVIALAKEMGAVPPEDFALALAAFFVASQEAITRARISIDEFGWTPIGATGYSFARAGDEGTVLADDTPDAGLAWPGRDKGCGPAFTFALADAF